MAKARYWNGGNGEGDFEVPEHALVAPAAAEFHAQEFVFPEVPAPVFAFLAAEDHAVGVGDDPVARFGGADVEVVGDLEGAWGGVSASQPQGEGGDEEEE